ncbi:Protein of unknown function (DUF2971) [Shimia isoporae]|uniref:DUF2971 domain-containing protein n=1 Tax=Shimia isoporae TaxID=647720 RepID=A0A4R1NLG5_9RHOB|nr:DUF2971 domain-containing protein [Shimia isoporae]TCL08955.1 Protein of unknown function (DUF2971) [Shimia isoporae]
MTKSKRKDWLKKFTKLEHLEGTPSNNGLYMGDPSSWPDRNDAFAIDHAYPDGARVLCMSQGPDRFHMWSDYGGKELGVCLWFDKSEFVGGLNDRLGIQHGDVIYSTAKNGKLKFCGKRPKNAAFTKRAQNSDEREYRIVQPSRDDHTLSFPKASLKRIYLNSWLEPCCVEREAKRISDLLVEHDYCKSVEVLQSRLLGFQKWQNALQADFPKAAR